METSESAAASVKMYSSASMAMASGTGRMRRRISARTVMRLVPSWLLRRRKMRAPWRESMRNRSVSCSTSEVRLRFQGPPYSVSDDSGFRILLHRFHYTAEFLGRPPIIAIEESDNFPLALRNPGVECGGLAAIWFSQQTHARLEPANDFRGGVGRPIVDDEDFHAVHRHVLFEDAGDGALNKTLVIVRVD